ncbi:MAG: hypothetical protein VR64_00575 [Desulfatitalea sp. BRH_c12]|nr:MAG: hypothetical protein VR64_00575 [Desulfatitalea sp. BRH_c12]
MSRFIQRDYPRIIHQAAIKYVPKNNMELRPAFMQNYSITGLCFASDQALDLDSEICIVMEDYHPECFGPECFRSYRARIRWHHPLIRREGFATGAQFVARSHDLLAYDDDITRCACDLCGSLAPADQMAHTCADTCLCPYCNAHIDHLPEGKIRRCLERFLTGNVV